MVGGVRRSHLVVFDFNFTMQKRKGRGAGRKGGAMGWGGVARGGGGGCGKKRLVSLSLRFQLGLAMKELIEEDPHPTPHTPLLFPC